MTEKTCYVCNSALSAQGGRAFCSNDACASGGLFLRCGYCKEYSFSTHPEQMACANPDCRMHRVKRGFCQACSKTSVITFSGRTFCLNRSCSTNASLVTECVFCGNRSFLRIPRVMACTKGDCAFLLSPMEECRRCKKLSLERSEMRCRNRDCKLRDVKVGKCPECGHRSLVQDPKHEHNGHCLEEDCKLYHAARRAPEEVTEVEFPMPVPPKTVGISPDEETEIHHPHGKKEAPTTVKLGIPATGPSMVALFRECFLGTLPVYTIIGLNGSGRRTYLTMLGEILAHREFRYHFPWTGIDIPRLQKETVIQDPLRRRPEKVPEELIDELRRRVTDLAYDFAPDQLISSIGREMWMDPTPFQGTSRYPEFLVTRLHRQGKPFSQILYVGAPAAANDSTIRGFRACAEGKGEAGACQEAFVDIVDRSSGVVILMDPENDENGEAYLDLFRCLVDAVTPRALQALQARVAEILEKDGGVRAIREALVDLAGGERTETDGDVRRAVARALMEAGLDDDLRRALPTGLPEASTTPRFPHLRHLAVAITKSDMYPVVSPAFRYPDQRMPKCRPVISALDASLRLCGGGIRFYNTSATGFSILKDTQYYPGKENTLTPINVAEPIFDMIMP